MILLTPLQTNHNHRAAAVVRNPFALPDSHHCDATTRNTVPTPAKSTNHRDMAVTYHPVPLPGNHQRDIASRNPVPTVNSSNHCNATITQDAAVPQTNNHNDTTPNPTSDIPTAKSIPLNWDTTKEMDEETTAAMKGRVLRSTRYS